MHGSDIYSGPPCFNCNGRSDSGQIFRVRNAGRFLCSGCCVLSRVPFFAVSGVKMNEPAPPPPLPPRALSDWSVERTDFEQVELLGVCARRVIIVWRCEVVAP